MQAASKRPWRSSSPPCFKWVGHDSCSAKPVKALTCTQPWCKLCVCSLEINWCGVGKLFTVGLPRNQTPPFVLTPFQLTRIMDGWKDTEDEITATSPPCMPGKDLAHHYLPPLPPLHPFSPLRLHLPFCVFMLSAWARAVDGRSWCM